MYQTYIISMTPAKKQKGKPLMHSSCFIDNPQGKLPSKGFSTFHSLQHRKNASPNALDPHSLFAITCKKEFEMIQTMSKGLWLNDGSTLKVQNKNMHDLLLAIQRQKQINEFKERFASRQKKGSVNEACLKIFESIKGTEERQASSTLNNFSKRSRSFEFAKQPTKVTIFKKLMQFNRNQQSDRTLEEKSRAVNTHVSRITPKASLLSPLQAPCLARDAKRFRQCQKEELPMMQGIQRQQSIQCRGEILGKEDEIKKRRNRMRHLSLIQQSIVKRPQQPIFLQEV